MILQFWCLTRVLQKIVQLHVAPRGPVQPVVFGYLEHGEQRWLVFPEEQLRDPITVTLLKGLNNGLRLLRGRM